MKVINLALSSRLLAATALFCSAACTPALAAPKKVLVVTVNAMQDKGGRGFRHSSIPVAEKVIAELGKKSGAFTVDYARVEPNDPEFKTPEGKRDEAKINAAIEAVLAEKMSPAGLKKYDAVVFANTTGDLPLPDRQAFLDWIKSGKGFVAMHSASDTFHGYPPYIDMLGGEFQTHHQQVEIQPLMPDPKCPACAHFPDGKVFDEIYIIKNFDAAKVHRLLMLDKHPNEKTPGEYAVSWCKNYGKGRVFYTSLGHREDVWDPTWDKDRKNSKAVAEAYQASILHAIKWALKLENWDAKPQPVTQAETTNKHE
ncbi:MAG: ThuA domain-containing protein [Verrucomicrobia bacterium]|nr:MAG: ThuA domain-containing protein [Verrucomicrobiota bacterium]